MPTSMEMYVFRVSFTPEARADLQEIREHIAFESGSQRTAAIYIRRIKQFCMDMGRAPHRGERREHLRLGLRSIGFERRISVVFAVFDEERLVEIEGIHYGGRQRE